MHATALTSTRFALQTILHGLSVAMTLVVAVFSMIGLVRENAKLMTPLTAIWFLSSLTVLSTAASALDWYLGRAQYVEPGVVSPDVARKRETFRRTTAAIVVWSAVQTTLTLAMVSVYVHKYGYDDPFDDLPNASVQCSRVHAWQRMNEISFVTSSLVLIVTAMVYTIAHLHHLFDITPTVTTTSTPLLPDPVPAPAPAPAPARAAPAATPAPRGIRGATRPSGLPPLYPSRRGWRRVPGDDAPETEMVEEIEGR